MSTNRAAARNTSSATPYSNSARRSWKSCALGPPYSPGAVEAVAEGDGSEDGDGDSVDDGGDDEPEGEVPGEDVAEGPGEGDVVGDGPGSAYTWPGTAPAR